MISFKAKFIANVKYIIRHEVQVLNDYLQSYI